MAWGRQIEAEIDRRGLHPDRSVLEQQTVGDLLNRYRDTVSIHKRSAASEQSLIDYLLKQKVTDYALAQATPDTLRQFRDTRLRVVSVV